MSLPPFRWVCPFLPSPFSTRKMYPQNAAPPFRHASYHQFFASQPKHVTTKRKRIFQQQDLMDFSCFVFFLFKHKGEGEKHNERRASIAFSKPFRGLWQ